MKLISSLTTIALALAFAASCGRTPPQPESSSLDRASLGQGDDAGLGSFVQVARQGNPLFNEGLVGFSRLGIFGGDTLVSSVQTGFGGGTVPGGWPNGRRFGDDVADIAVTALISDLRVSPPIIRGPAGDNVNSNDIAYNKVFPYAATPLNGRTHTH